MGSDGEGTKKFWRYVEEEMRGGRRDAAPGRPEAADEDDMVLVKDSKGDGPSGCLDWVGVKEQAGGK